MPEILLFNKPFGVLSQFSDGEGRETLSAYIPLPGFYPAGRLDRDSEGLLVLTNAGRLQHRISDPMHKQPKTYWVQVEGVPDRGALARLEQGVELRDGLTAPARAFLLAEPEVWPRTPPIRHRAQIPTAWVELVLTEGRNRQVRRMTAAVGYPTLRLIRHAVGPWDLSGLAPGTWRVLGAAEPTVVKLMHDMGTPRNRGRRGRTERAIPDRRRTGRGPDRR